MLKLFDIKKEKVTSVDGKSNVLLSENVDGIRSKLKEHGA